MQRIVSRTDPYYVGGMTQISQARFDQIAAEGTARIERVTLGEHMFWIKRVEALDVRMRLQKGNAQTAFEAERQAYRTLNDAGLPVPPIVAEGEGYFVTPDSGQTVASIIKARTMAPEDRLRVFEAVADGLWAFHAAGISHGRPSLKDICWDGTTVRFIDFERFDPSRNTPQGHAEDLVIMVFNALSLTQAPCPEIDALLARYRAQAPDDIWRLAQKWCRKHRWVNWLTKPVQMRGVGKAREFKAIPLTLQAFSDR